VLLRASKALWLGDTVAIIGHYFSFLSCVFTHRWLDPSANLVTNNGHSRREGQRAAAGRGLVTTVARWLAQTCCHLSSRVHHLLNKACSQSCCLSSRVPHLLNKASSQSCCLSSRVPHLLNNALAKLLSFLSSAPPAEQSVLAQSASQNNLNRP
jgi:hypothetical protein